jgi:penicillin-binding protein 1A
LVRKVSNADGITLWEDAPTVDEVIDQQTARTMMILLRAVTAHGTGAAVAQLNHPLGGKTGTTSDFTDAWFLGFSPSITCGVWVGYDSRESLGEKETGAKAALPIWINVMRQAIIGKDDEQFLVDAKEPQMLKATAEPPSKPAAAKLPIAVPTPAALVKASNPAKANQLIKVNSLVKPTASPAPSSPALKRPAQPAAKDPEPPNTYSVWPQVRPALPQQAAPAKPGATVKPALGTNPRR